MEKCKSCEQIPHKGLREVLMPFAKMGAELRGDEFVCLYEITGSNGQRVRITMEHLKKAQEMLGVPDTRNW